MVRGGMRNGGGGMMRGPMRNIRPPFKKTFVPRHPFDLTLTDNFNYVKPSNQPDDSALTAALLKRNQDLTPQVEQTNLANLVTKIQLVLDNLVVAAGDFNTCVSKQLFYNKNKKL